MALDQQTPRAGWQLDRKVSLAFVLSVVVIVFGGIRWIGAVEGDQAEIDRRVAALEAVQPTAATDHVKIAVLEATLAQLQKQVDETRQIVDEIRTLLIQERSQGARTKGH
jgi:Tfp pilus assembly protein PilO